MLRGKTVASSPITICVTGFPLQDLGSDGRESNLVQSGKALETAVANDILIQFRSGGRSRTDQRVTDPGNSLQRRRQSGRSNLCLQLYKVRLNRSVANL